jgi:hypothetical protein
MLRWRTRVFGVFPVETRSEFLLSLVFDRAILSGFAVVFWTPLARITAMTRFELGHAYLLISPNLVVVFPLNRRLLSESVTLQGIMCMGFVVLRTEIAARG